MGHPDRTAAPSNVVHLADFMTPSYRRHRTRSATPATATAWAAAARQRARTPEPLASTTPALPSSARVRVTHFPEPANGGGAARLRISGRLADVCAELDRLVEAEAQAAVRRA